MIIERKIQYELTEAELKQAYYEYKHILDKEDVKALLREYDDMDDEFKDTYGISRDQITDEMISAIATEMRNNMDQYGQDMESARKDAMKDKLYEFANHCRILEKRLPIYVPIVLIRNRPSENEQWADTFYMKVNPHASKLANFDPESYLRDLIGKWMTTKAGWAANVRSCMDFNWGDFVCEFPFDEDEFNLFWNLPNGRRYEILPTQTISVDQDEHLAPSEVMCYMLLFKDGDENAIFSGWSQVDLQTGEVTPNSEPDDQTIRSAVRGVIMFPYGWEPGGDSTSLELDPDEDYMRLKRG